MKLSILFFGLLYTLTTLAQSDLEIWDETSVVSTDIYEFQVPTVWRDLGSMLSGANDPEQFFEASGHGLPISYNGGPVKVNIFLVEIKDAKSLKDATKKTIEGYFMNPDRVFEKKNKYTQESLKLSNSDDGIVLSTRFYRTSKNLNQSRFDLVVYSNKYKTAYTMTMSIQYADEKYQFEADYELESFAKELFATFVWR